MRRRRTAARRLGYEVSVGDGLPIQLRPNSTSLDFDPMTLRSVSVGGEDITYTVRALNAVGSGSVASGTFTLLDVPGTPTAVSAVEIGASTVRVTVSGLDNDGYGRTAGVVGHGVQVDDVDLNLVYVVSVISGGDVLDSTQTTSTSVTFAGLDLVRVADYQLEARVRNAVGAGAAQTGAFTIAKVPGDPGLVAARWAGTQRLVLSWTAPEAEGGSAITDYEVRVGGESMVQMNSNSTSLDFDPTTLRSVSAGGENIAYTVRAENAAGFGSTASGTFRLLNVPGTPTAVSTVEIGASTVRVTVSGLDNDGYGRTAGVAGHGVQVDDVDLNLVYVVSVISGGDVLDSTQTTSTSVTFAGLDLVRVADYQLEARVRNAVGAGAALAGFFTGTAEVPGVLAPSVTASV